MLLEGEHLQKWEQEAGGHRIQRVPPTEKRGRVHTSTVTVAVLDTTENSKIKLSLDDCEITWFSGTGPGGQNRNKVMASCRLRHKPTGIVTTAQTRSRTNSLQQAQASMLERLQTLQDSKVAATTGAERKQQVGSGQRGDKIRTIQLQHDSAVDHRTGRRCTAEDYLRGHMDKLWN